MSHQSTEIEFTNLGEFLRETRLSLNIDLSTVAEETRISSKCLQAIEENDFNALPADAFARGFYTLYAKSLALDPLEILERYTQERPKHHKSGFQLDNQQNKRAQEVGNMAERPTFVPFSFFGLTLLLFLLFGGFLCWYFSWNPATFLSQKLRSLETPTEIEQVSANETEPDILDPISSFARLQKRSSKGWDFFSISTPSAATATTVQAMDDSSRQPDTQISKYYLHTAFNSETKSNLTLNDPPFNLPGSNKRCVSNCLPNQFLQ